MIQVLEREIATFEARRAALMSSHRGEFVLIKATNIVGFFPDEDAALREGYRMFGDAPFLAMQLTEGDQHVALTSRFAGPPIV